MKIHRFCSCWACAAARWAEWTLLTISSSRRYSSTLKNTTVWSEWAPSPSREEKWKTRFRHSKRHTKAAAIQQCFGATSAWLWSKKTNLWPLTAVSKGPFFWIPSDGTSTQTSRSSSCAKTSRKRLIEAPSRRDPPEIRPPHQPRWHSVQFTRRLSLRAQRFPQCREGLLVGSKNVTWEWVVRV